MAEAKWLGVLSTTEPRNDVGIIKVRQGNVNSEIAEFQIVQNNKPYNLTGLTVYFCASFGLNLVEKPAVVINTTGGRIQYTFDDDSMQEVGRQKGYFSIKKAESKIDSTQDFEFQVESSLMTRSIDGKSYIYKLSTLIKVLDDFIKNGQNNFNVWFESVKEILYGVDPGGNILRELIESRTTAAGKVFASLKARLDKNEQETTAHLSDYQSYRNVLDYGVTNDGVDTEDTLNALEGGYTYVLPAGDYGVRGFDDNALESGLMIKSNTKYIFLPGAKVKIIPNGSFRYAGISIVNAENFELVNPHVIGDRDEHDYSNITNGTTHEWGRGIAIRGNSKGKIYGAKAENTTGDGLDFIANADSDVEFYEITKIERARRNGVSFESCGRVFFENLEINNTYGTAPQAGIDFEPFENYHTLKDIYIKKLKITNSKSTGLVFAYLELLTEYNIKIDDVEADGINFSNTLQQSNGKILIDKLRITGNNFGVISTDSYANTIINYLIVDMGIPDIGKSPSIIYVDRTDYSRYSSIGGLVFKEVEVLNKETNLGLIEFNLTKVPIAQRSFSNIEMNIVKNNLIGKAIKFTDDLPVTVANVFISEIPNANTNMTVADLSGRDTVIGKQFTNTAAAEKVVKYIHSEVNLRLRNTPFTFEVTDPKGISIRSSIESNSGYRILPFNAGWVTSTQVGSKLKLVYAGEVNGVRSFKALEIIGNWQVG